MKDVFCKWNCAKILQWGPEDGGGAGAGRGGGGSWLFYHILSFLLPLAQPSSSFPLAEVPDMEIDARSTLRLCQGASDI